MIVAISKVTTLKRTVKLERPLLFIKIAAVWRYKICFFSTVEKERERRNELAEIDQFTDYLAWEKSLFWFAAHENFVHE